MGSCRGVVFLRRGAAVFMFAARQMQNPPHLACAPPPRGRLKFLRSHVCVEAATTNRFVVTCSRAQAFGADGRSPPHIDPRHRPRFSGSRASSHLAWLNQ